MRVEIRQVEGLTFIGKGDTNHWMVTDGPREYFGSEAASKPMELLLIALGSCTASDVAAILNKKRVKLDGFKVVVEGERADDHPKVFTKIHIDFIFYGKNLEKKHLERAIELSQGKYCPISAMLGKAVNITYSYKILEEE